MFKYAILVPWAGENRITLTEPETAEIAVTEPPIPEDPDTYIEGGLPPMAAYITPGDVSGELVYVNYAGFSPRNPSVTFSIGSANAF